MRDNPTIGIVGGGAWGTALALVAARAGRTVTLYARDAATVGAINQRRENVSRLPRVGLDAAITATGDIAAAAGADAVLLPFRRSPSAPLPPASRPTLPLAHRW